MDLHGRSLLAVTDLSAEEFTYLVGLARDLRSEKRFGFGYDEHRLAGRNIALIFEKTSTRTRAAYEVAAHDEGAHVSYLARARPARPQGVGQGHRPCARPHVRRHRVPRVRPGSGRDARGLRRGAGVERADRHLAPDPDAGRHPHGHRSLREAAVEVSLCYLGDGRNNTANSLLVTGALLGMDLRICSPRGCGRRRRSSVTAGRLRRVGGPANRHRATCGRPSRARTSCTPTPGCPWASPSRSGTRGSTSCSPTR